MPKLERTLITCHILDREDEYEPVLKGVQEVMGRSSQLHDATALCERVLARWPAGTRQRQIMRQNLYAFLRFCVERYKFKECQDQPCCKTCPERHR
jgi:hypothetical protein